MIGLAAGLAAPAREDVLQVLLRDPAVHVYGIADLTQLWSRSRWYRRGDATVGIIEVPGSDAPILYAVAAGAEEPTVELLRDLAPQLPPRVILHAALGATDRLVAAGYRPRWRSRFVKWHLARPDRLPPPDGRVRLLTGADLSALEELYATDADAGGFFHAGLLDVGPYVGLVVDGGLVAAAGVHVVCRERGVAAVANVATHPGFRRRGAASAVVSALCHRLLEELDVIGLNVRERNRAAAGLYGRLGFAPVVTYEEAELARPS